eukprot:1750818-Prymnesium_polylepis.2
MSASLMRHGPEPSRGCTRWARKNQIHHPRPPIPTILHMRPPSFLINLRSPSTCDYTRSTGCFRPAGPACPRVRTSEGFPRPTTGRRPPPDASSQRGRRAKSANGRL